MVTAEEALRSTDPNEVKRLRGSISTQISCDVKLLQKELAKKVGVKFDYGEISPQLIKNHKKKLLLHYELIQKLQERYVEVRDEGLSNEEESALVELDVGYIEDISSKVCPLLDKIDQYEEGLANLATCRSLVKTEKDRHEAVKKSKSEFKMMYDKIKNELERIEAHSSGHEKDNLIQLIPTDSFIRDLSATFNELKKSCNRLNEVQLAAEKDGDESKLEADCSIEHADFLSLDIKLKTYAQAKLLLKDKALPAATCEDTSKSVPLKINKPEALKFSGDAREFASFKRDFMAIVVPNRDSSQIGMHFKQAIPDKHKHLLSNKDLDDWKSMMSIIEEELANPKLIIDIAVKEIEQMKTASSDKAFMDFVEALERIERDLKTLGQLSEIANTSVLSKIESKLPSQINHDWTQKVVKEKLCKQTSAQKFETFMEFLREAKEMTRYNVSLSNSSGKNHCFVTGTLVAQNKGEVRGTTDKTRSSNMLPCIACNVDGATDLNSSLHHMKSCMVWGNLSHRERVSMVRCVKHPFSRDEHETKDCKRIVRACSHCQKENDHNSLLCPRFQVQRKGSTNLSLRCLHVNASDRNSQPELPPTLLYTIFTKTQGGKQLGTLIDNASTDDYILNQTAKKMKLRGYPVELITEGFGGVETKITTNLYYVPIYDEKGRLHQLPCYGTERITNDPTIPDAATYEKMCRQFGVDPREVRRPKKIELLISLRSGHLHPSYPNPVVIGGMRLVSGPLGKVFGGSCPELRFNQVSFACPLVTAQVDNVCPIRSTTMKCEVRQAIYTTPLKTDREILNFFNEEQIGVHCTPRCGDCRCGTCAIGSKQMSIKDEMDYEKFKSLMYLDSEGTVDDPGPYWRTGFPWTIEPKDMIDNKAAVAAVMNSTKRKLSKNPEWREVYESQLKTLVEKGFAREVSIDEIKAWEAKGGKTYYIAHQMALNPQSKTTPVRCCFNSSQRYRGYSLNTSWELGPDLVNSLHSVLLRFRKDLVAAQGDITKMYYMVRIREEESWMQLFMWEFAGEDKLKYFKMERLVMGNKPSASLSGVALAETAKLENFPKQFPAAHRALTSDAYVDNVFLTAPDHVSIKSIISDIEYVAAKGGFFFKPFIISGDNQPDTLIGVALPDAIGANEEKALGVYWDVQNDSLYIKADLFKIGKRTKRGIKVVTVEMDPSSRITVAPHLTLRACLSLHARPFDPLGLILPTKVIGNILFRHTLQQIKKNNRGKIPWDEPIEGELKKQWCNYFEMLLKLETIHFPRSFKPENVDTNIKPDFCTFNDGNPDAYGTVGYARWTLTDGSKACRLLLSKSRLGPLTHKGETVRNELAGSTLSARLKHWVQKNSEVMFGNFYHFLDSRIVKDMLPKDSYGFNTFVGLRVAEVQQKTSIDDWKHIPSDCNIADILTKGAPPQALGRESEWQNGPVWLRLEESCWPVSKQSSSTGLENDTELVQFYRKNKVMTSHVHITDSLDELASRCSTLNKLLNCVAYILRWRLPSKATQEVHVSNDVAQEFPAKFIRPIEPSERDDAMNIIVALEQGRKLHKHNTEKLAPKVIPIRLNNYNFEISHTVVGGRIKNFPIAFAGHCQDIPILPPGDLSKLVVKFYHDKYHKEVDSTVSHVRNDYWVIRCRKLASQIDHACVQCKIQRKNRAGQVMGELPDFRTSMQPAFTVVGCDLWGPINIRDDVVKRGPRVVKKAWGVLLTCLATRAIYLDIACGSSTEELLHVIRRAMARCGRIQTIISDPGTNLIGAAREMQDWRNSWDKEMLKRFSAERGIQWNTIMANSQHQNGATEVMIKLAKSVMKSLMKSIGEQVLNLNEMNTLLAETAQLVNERPIGLKPNESVDSVYLSPNSLLLGRNSDRICSGPFISPDQNWDDPSSFRNRFLLVQAIVEQFWRNWMKLFFPSLVIRQRWHVRRRNLQKGDVCIIKDSNMLRGEWRMAVVACTYPDRNNQVRNVELLVKPKQGGNAAYVPTAPVYVKRHVNNVVLLVPSDEAVCNDQDTPLTTTGFEGGM